MSDVKKTLYVSDLDGTLLSPEAELSVYSREALRRMTGEGVHFTAATARTAATVVHLLDGAGLTLPLVTMNGAVIWDMGTNRPALVRTIPPEIAAAVLGVWRDTGLGGMVYTMQDGKLVTYVLGGEQEPLQSFVEERRRRFGKTFVMASRIEDLPTENVVYFCHLATKERIEAAQNALEAVDNLSQTSKNMTPSALNRALYPDNYSDMWYLELFSGEASKKTGVKWLRDLGRYDRVVGFGDNLNDLPMFAACDVRIAVANAHPEVIAAADIVCGSNAEDGVVRWIEDNRQ